MKNDLVSLEDFYHRIFTTEDFYHKIWGIGDHYQKKRGMFFETSYVLVSGRSTREKPSLSPLCLLLSDILLGFRLRGDSGY